MKARRHTLFAIGVTLVLLLISSALSVAAQVPDGSPGAAAYKEPWTGPSEKSPDKTHYPPGLDVQPPEPRGVAPQATGGPDLYGYTWDDSVAFNWIDATTGSDSGLQGDDMYLDGVDIGFDFPYYDNVFSQLAFSTNGLVTFGQVSSAYINHAIPNPAPPNSYVGPFWDDLCVNYGGYNTGAIYTLQGGTAPNRYFVIEWHEVSKLGNYDLITFEVILHESGDIVLQYLSLAGTLDSATVGTEDDLGTDGLQYLYNAAGLVDGLAVRFTRPGAVPRVKAWPVYQGEFAAMGAPAEFDLFIRNSGGSGTDTYDLTVSSSWDVLFFAEDGTTPLTDTNANGLVDTGPLAQLATFTVTAEIDPPPLASVGDHSQADVTVRSSLDTDKAVEVHLQTGIPAPFAQVYRQESDRALSFYLAGPDEQTLHKLTADNYWPEELAVAEGADSFAYLWSRFMQYGSVYTREIWYVLVDHDGNIVKEATQLTDHQSATMLTYDSLPVVAVAPDGTVGVAWNRQIYDSDLGENNYNVWFASLDTSGDLIAAPMSVTMNDLWGPGNVDVPRFYDARVAATNDNRFLLAWNREMYNGSIYLYDILYAVLKGDGSEVKPVTNFTENPPDGSHYHYSPGIAQLRDGNVLLAWYMGSKTTMYYAVLDSSGESVKAWTPFSNPGSYGTRPDPVGLSNGHSVIAWEAYYVDANRIWFSVLDANHDQIGGPMVLENPPSYTGDAYPSATADSDGNAILTWIDADRGSRRHLYYALVDSAGDVVTDPMIFRTDESDSPYLFSSFVGCGNTSNGFSYTWNVYLPYVAR